MSEILPPEQPIEQAEFNNIDAQMMDTTSEECGIKKSIKTGGHLNEEQMEVLQYGSVRLKYFQNDGTKYKQDQGDYALKFMLHSLVGALGYENIAAKRSTGFYFKQFPENKIREITLDYLRFQSEVLEPALDRYKAGKAYDPVPTSEFENKLAAVYHLLKQSNPASQYCRELIESTFEMVGLDLMKLNSPIKWSDSLTIADTNTPYERSK